MPTVTSRDLTCVVCTGAPPGRRTLWVVIATLPPFTISDVSATLSGLELRPDRLPRDAVTLPVTPVPALNTVAPLTTTFWSSCPVKVVPTGSLSEILLVVRTVRAVPAGIVPCAVEVPEGPEVEQAAR